MRRLKVDVSSKCVAYSKATFTGRPDMVDWLMKHILPATSGPVKVLLTQSANIPCASQSGPNELPDTISDAYMN